MTYAITANGVIHREGCSHRNGVQVLSGGYASVEEAREAHEMDFESTPIKVAACAKPNQVTFKTFAERDAWVAANAKLWEGMKATSTPGFIQDPKRRSRWRSTILLKVRWSL